MSTVFVDYGHLQKRDPNYGLRLACYACGRMHKARNIACIRSCDPVVGGDFVDVAPPLHVPLCNSCFDNDQNGVVRKFLGSPDLKVSEGGNATTEQLHALAEKVDKTEQ